MAGPGTRLLGCLGAAQIDRVRQHQLDGHPRQGLLGRLGRRERRGVGADEVVVVATLAPRRTVEEVPYVTSPGDRVRALVTDLGTFERREGRLVLTAVPAAGDGEDGDGATIAERVEVVARALWMGARV